MEIKKIISDINQVLNQKYKYANQSENLKFLTDNIKDIDKKKIIYLTDQLDRYEIINKFLILLNNFDIAAKIEAGIFEYTLIYNNIRNLANSLLISVYQDKVSELLLYINPDSHLVNLTLKPDLLSGKINPQYLAFLKPYEIHPDHWAEFIKRKNYRENKRNNISTTDLYSCPRCKHTRCTVMQLQTRKGDEGMTTFLTCLNCYHRFRKEG